MVYQLPQDEVNYLIIVARETGMTYENYTKEYLRIREIQGHKARMDAIRDLKPKDILDILTPEEIKTLKNTHNCPICGFEFVSYPTGWACEIDLGQWCNNDGRHRVADLEVCPQPAPGSIPLVPDEVSELEWMKKKQLTV